MAVAVIQRHSFAQFPPITDYLSLDDERTEFRVWKPERLLALEFGSHGQADARADAIRKQTTEHVHAVVCEKPMLHRPVLDPLTKVKIPKVDRYRELQCRRDPVESL